MIANTISISIFYYEDMKFSPVDIFAQRAIPISLKRRFMKPYSILHAENYNKKISSTSFGYVSYFTHPKSISQSQPQADYDNLYLYTIS